MILRKMRDLEKGGGRWRRKSEKEACTIKPGLTSEEREENHA